MLEDEEFCGQRIYLLGLDRKQKTLLQLRWLLGGSLVIFVQLPQGLVLSILHALGK